MIIKDQLTDQSGITISIVAVKIPSHAAFPYYCVSAINGLTGLGRISAIRDLQYNVQHLTSYPFHEVLSKLLEVALSKEGFRRLLHSVWLHQFQHNFFQYCVL